MKKNVMMRLASFLLVAVLISTSAISGTYAKYVTQASAEDTARVAKWGVSFDIEGGPMFSKSYATDDTDTWTAMTYSVKSDANVVAPGTKGNAITFRILGTPEVSYTVKFSFAENAESVLLNKYAAYNANGTFEKWVDISTTYEPVAYTYTLGNQPQKVANLTTMMADINAYEIYFDVTAGKYYERTSATAAWTEVGKEAPKLIIDWEWDFDDNGAGTYDVYDTTLGNIAAGVLDVSELKNGIDYNTEIVLGLTATATQID